MEDRLNDGWLQWGMDNKIPFFTGIPRAHERLRFWTDYETEIQLAAATGIKVGSIERSSDLRISCVRYSVWVSTGED